MIVKERDEMRRTNFQLFMAQFSKEELLFVDKSSKDNKTFQVCRSWYCVWARVTPLWQLRHLKMLLTVHTAQVVLCGDVPPKRNTFFVVWGMRLSLRYFKRSFQITAWGLLETKSLVVFSISCPYLLTKREIIFMRKVLEKSTFVLKSYPEF